jgi:hypothetical protein
MVRLFKEKLSYIPIQSFIIQQLFAKIMSVEEVTWFDILLFTQVSQIDHSLLYDDIMMTSSAYDLSSGHPLGLYVYIYRHRAY